MRIHRFTSIGLWIPAQSANFKFCPREHKNFVAISNLAINLEYAEAIEAMKTNDPQYDYHIQPSELWFKDNCYQRGYKISHKHPKWVSTRRALRNGNYPAAARVLFETPKGSAYECLDSQVFMIRRPGTTGWITVCPKHPNRDAIISRCRDGDFGGALMLRNALPPEWLIREDFIRLTLDNRCYALDKVHSLYKITMADLIDNSASMAIDRIKARCKHYTEGDNLFFKYEDQWFHVYSTDTNWYESHEYCSKGQYSRAARTFRGKNEAKKQAAADAIRNVAGIPASGDLLVLRTDSNSCTYQEKPKVTNPLKTQTRYLVTPIPPTDDATVLLEFKSKRKAIAQAQEAMLLGKTKSKTFVVLKETTRPVTVIGKSIKTPSARDF